VSIAFKPEDAREAIKEYTGQIVAAEYSMKPFNFEGDPSIKRETKVLGIQLKTDEYEKPQYEWYPPSKVKKTKWIFLLEALIQTGAMKEISTAGASDDEIMENFRRSLLGMKFKWEEKECESLVKVRGGEFKRFTVLLPVAYLGKQPIVAAPEIRQETVGESLR
jgi:hypothetical protein